MCVCRTEISVLIGLQYDPILIFNTSGIDIKQLKYFPTAFSYRFLRFPTDFLVHIPKAWGLLVVLYFRVLIRALDFLI